MMLAKNWRNQNIHKTPDVTNPFLLSRNSIKDDNICWKEKKIPNKKHSENADTSTSVIFNLELWPWPGQGQKGLCHKMSLVVFNLVPGMMSVILIVCEIWPLIHCLWPLTFAYDLPRQSRSLSFLSLDGRYVLVYWF